MKTAVRLISSTRSAAVLSAVLVVSMIIGSLLKGDRAWDWVFGAWWFNILLALFCVSAAVCRLRRRPRSLREVGSFLTHLSFLVILAGVVVGYAWGRDGFIEIRTGEVRTTYESEQGPQPLGFGVRLDEFSLEYYDVGPWVLRVKPSGKAPTYTIVPESGMAYPVPGTPYTVRVHELSPGFARESTDGGKGSPVQENPSVRIELRGIADSTPFVITANNRREKLAEWEKRLPAGMRISLERLPGRPKQYRSRLAFLVDQRVVRKATAYVNGPVEHQGWTFYQMGYDEEAHDWTGLGVKRDPGVPLVYAGYVMLVVGLAVVTATRTQLGRPTAEMPGNLQDGGGHK